MMTTGQRLRQLRHERDLSLEEAARLLHLSFSALAMYERDERTPSADKLQQLADLYGVSVDYLLARDDQPVAARENAAPYAADDLAERWPNLSPDRRRTAAQWERASRTVGTPTLFGKDLTNEQFDKIMSVLTGAMIGVTTAITQQIEKDEDKKQAAGPHE